MTVEQAQQLIEIAQQISTNVYLGAQVLCVICGVLLFIAVQSAFKI